MKGEPPTPPPPGEPGRERALLDLSALMQFTERVSARIHGAGSPEEIFRLVKEEFLASGRYTMNVLLLAEDGTALKLAESSVPPEILRAMEEVAGASLADYRIELSRSSVFRRVVVEEETVTADGAVILGELLPPQLVQELLGALPVGRQPSLITPLKKGERVIGVLTVTAPELTEYFVPSVRNLALHLGRLPNRLSLIHI